MKNQRMLSYNAPHHIGWWNSKLSKHATASIEYIQIKFAKFEGSTFYSGASNICSDWLKNILHRCLYVLQVAILTTIFCLSPVKQIKNKTVSSTNSTTCAVMIQQTACVPFAWASSTISPFGFAPRKTCLKSRFPITGNELMYRRACRYTKAN